MPDNESRLAGVEHLTLADLCSCGRSRVVTYSRADGTLLGFCGQPNHVPLTPCDAHRFAEADHDATWCAIRTAQDGLPLDDAPSRRVPVLSAPGWADHHTEEDAGIRWSRRASVVPMREPDVLSGAPVLVALEVSARDRLAVDARTGEVVIERWAPDVMIGDDIWTVAEARRLAVAITELCDAVEQATA